VQTCALPISFYASMAGGPRKCTTQSPAGFSALTRDLSEGNLCASITADWSLTYIKMYGSVAAGNWRMMPMPVFDSTDTPTSTRGGTMMGITKACRDPELAWKLTKYMYFSKDGLRARQQESDILPPVREFWKDPFYNQPDPFLGGQKGGALYVQLADKIPRRYVTPMSPVASLILNDDVVRAVNYANVHGEAGLEQACRGWLKISAERLKERIKQM